MNFKFYMQNLCASCALLSILFVFCIVAPMIFNRTRLSRILADENQIHRQNVPLTSPPIPRYNSTVDRDEENESESKMNQTISDNKNNSNNNNNNNSTTSTRPNPSSSSSSIDISSNFTTSTPESNEHDAQLSKTDFQNPPITWTIIIIVSAFFAIILIAIIIAIVSYYRSCVGGKKEMCGRNAGSGVTRNRTPPNDDNEDAKLNDEIRMRIFDDSHYS